MKKIAIILAALVLLAFLSVGLFIDSIVASAIEGAATSALGVETEVGSTDVGLLSGGLALSNLRIANPPGYETPHLLTLGHVDARISVGSLWDDTIVTERILLEDLSVNAETRGGKLNFEVVRENVRRTGSAKPSGEGAGKTVKRFVIDELLIRNTTAQVKTPILNLSTEIPEIRLTDIGKEGGRGVSHSELAQLILKEVEKAATKGNTSPGGGLLDKLKEKLGRP